MCAPMWKNLVAGTPEQKANAVRELQARQARKKAKPSFAQMASIWAGKSGGFPGNPGGGA